MHYQADVSDTVYRYDGSFQGFLCCVFESFARREIPAAVCTPQTEQLTLFALRDIPTDEQRARRVFAGVGRLGGQLRYRLTTAFLSAEPDKDLTLLRFVRRAFEAGPGAAQMLGDPEIAAAWALERAVNNEAHLLLEFLRFEERGGMLGAVIHPKNRVLPLLRAHFCSRLPDESFMIYDATHGVAMLRRGDEVRYLEMQDYAPEPDEAEENWQQLWQGFFRALTIEERRNPRCQRTHCPQTLLAGYVRDAAGPRPGKPSAGQWRETRAGRGYRTKKKGRRPSPDAGTRCGGENSRIARCRFWGGRCRPPAQSSGRGMIRKQKAPPPPAWDGKRGLGRKMRAGTGGAGRQGRKVPPIYPPRRGQNGWPAGNAGRLSGQSLAQRPALGFGAVIGGAVADSRPR